MSSRPRARGASRRGRGCQQAAKTAPADGRYDENDGRRQARRRDGQDGFHVRPARRRDRGRRAAAYAGTARRFAKASGPEAYRATAGAAGTSQTRPETGGAAEVAWSWGSEAAWARRRPVECSQSFRKKEMMTEVENI